MTPQRKASVSLLKPLEKMGHRPALVAPRGGPLTVAAQLKRPSMAAVANVISKKPLPQVRHAPKIDNRPAARLVAPRVQSIAKAAAPQVYRPQLPKVLQSKAPTVITQNRRVLVPAVRTAPNLQLKPSQPFGARVVQAMKFYPNLHPGAIEQVETSHIFRLNSFAGQYRLQRKHSHSVNVPNQQYNFVRTREGEMLLHNRYRHPSIAEGRQVMYAGEIFFNNGTLQWWSNGSGHYQPDAGDAEQANLPMDQFFSYQQVIKGEHKRKG